MFKAFRSKLMIQLAIIITIFIFFIETILLVFSIQTEEKKYHEIRAGIMRDIGHYTNNDFSKSFPKTLSDQDINQRIDRYIRNIVILVMIIILSVSLGTLVVFYKLAGAPILKIIQLNRQASKAKGAARYPQNKIPNNEIGEMIRERNDMLDRFENFEQELEDKVNEMKTTVIQATKMSLVGEFTSGIVHDINNPLSIIMMHMDRLEKHGGELFQENSKAKQSLERIQLATERIQNMTTRLGKLGRKELEFSNDTDLREVIDNSLSFLAYKLKPRNINVCNEIVRDLKCFGDINSLEQVFSNLFSNACDAMEASKEKTLTITERKSDNDQDIYIVVKDSGEGIPKEKVEDIFTRFYTTKDRGKGTGLGLSTCMRIIQDHGGEIEVDSTLGEGTAFTIKLKKEA